jgi:hypothetical protein
MAAKKETPDHGANAGELIEQGRRDAALLAAWITQKKGLIDNPAFNVTQALERSVQFRRAWLAVHGLPAKPTPADCRVFVERLIRHPRFVLEPWPRGTWPEDETERTAEVVRREMIITDSVIRALLDVLPQFKAKVNRDRVLATLRAQWNARGRGRKAPVKYRDALDQLFEDFDIWTDKPESATRSGRRKRAKMI